MAIANSRHSLKLRTGKPDSRQSQPLLRLLQYGKAYRWQFWLATLCSVLNKLFDLAPPVLIGIAVDVIVKQQDSLIAQLGILDVRAQFLGLAGLTVVIWVLESVFEYLYARLWRNLAQKIQHNLRLDAYAHLQELELEYFEARSTGGLMAILNDDINQLERFLDFGANEVIQVVVTVLAVGAGFFWIAPSVAWMAMLPMPLILWGSVTFQKRLAPRYADVRDKVGLLNSRLSNNLGGIVTIKSFVTEDYEIHRLRQESAAYRQSNRRAIALSAAFVPLIRMIILTGFTALLVYGGFAAIEGTMSVGTYSTLVVMIQRLLWPLTRLGETLDQYQRAMASTNRVMNLLDTPITIHSGTLPLPISPPPPLPLPHPRRHPPTKRHLRLPRPSAGAPKPVAPHSRRTNHRDRRFDRIGQKYAGEAVTAALRHSIGQHYAGRHRVTRPATARSAAGHRLGEPGCVFVPRLGAGKYYLRQS